MHGLNKCQKTIKGWRKKPGHWLLWVMKVWSVSQDMLKVSWSLYWWPCHKFTAQSAGERILTISIWWNRQECSGTIDSRWPSFLRYSVNLVLTRAKDLLPNIHRMQGRRNHPRQQRNGTICHCMMSFAVMP